MGSTQQNATITSKAAWWTCQNKIPMPLLYENFSFSSNGIFTCHKRESHTHTAKLFQHQRSLHAVNLDNVHTRHLRGHGAKARRQFLAIQGIKADTFTRSCRDRAAIYHKGKHRWRIGHVAYDAWRETIVYVLVGFRGCRTLTVCLRKCLPRQVVAFILNSKNAILIIKSANFFSIGFRKRFRIVYGFIRSDQRPLAS